MRLAKDAIKKNLLRVESTMSDRWFIADGDMEASTRISSAQFIQLYSPFFGFGDF